MSAWSHLRTSDHVTPSHPAKPQSPTLSDNIAILQEEQLPSEHSTKLFKIEEIIYRKFTGKLKGEVCVNLQQTIDVIGHLDPAPHTPTRSGAQCVLECFTKPTFQANK